MLARSCNLATYPPMAAEPPCAALSLGVGRDFAAEAELAARHGCTAWIINPLVRRRPEPAASGRLNFLRLPFVASVRRFHDGWGLVRGPAVPLATLPCSAQAATHRHVGRNQMLCSSLLE